jgi:rare lipoprotein A
MKKYVMACAMLNGITGAAAAAEKGIASYCRFPHGNGMIAAHRTLPLGSQVRVTNLDNGRATVVKIVDRGPFIRGRIIDVSTAVAVALGFRQAGVAHVWIEEL